VDTADVFTGVSRGVDKLLWMVEAGGSASTIKGLKFASNYKQ